MDWSSPTTIALAMLGASLLTITTILTTKAVNAIWPLIRRRKQMALIVLMLMVPATPGAAWMIWFGLKNHSEAGVLAGMALAGSFQLSLTVFIYANAVWNTCAAHTKALHERLDALEKASGHAPSTSAPQLLQESRP